MSAVYALRDAIARAGDELLQNIVGVQTLGLLRTLDAKLNSPSGLRDLILSEYESRELLRDPLVRRSVIEALPREPAERLAIALNVPEHDPYSALAGLRFGRGSAQESRLFDFFGIEDIAEETPPLAPDLRTVEPSSALFVHQRQAVRDVQEFLQSDSPTVLLHMPTGSGKTRTAMHLIVDELNRREASTVLWLAFNDELCEQAAQEFERAWSAAGNRPVDLVRFWGDHNGPLDELRDGIAVLGLQKAYSLVRRGGPLARAGARASLVVIDEAHSAVAETYRAVLTILTGAGSQSGLLGLTATPGRTWEDIAADEELADFFGRNKVSLRIPGYPNPVRYLVEAGYLAEVEYRRIDAPSDPLSADDIAAIEAALDIPSHVLIRLSEDEQRNLAILTEIESLIRRGHQRILLFATTVEHCRVLSMALKMRGYRAAAITADTRNDDRRRHIEAFRSNYAEPMVLVNFGVLTTGFDAPRTSAALIARPTRSLVLYSQMVGRVTRGPKAGGNAQAEVVTVVDPGLPGFGDMAEAFENWEDVWQQ